jgi:molybdopterin converting factor small subunit
VRREEPSEVCERAGKIKVNIVGSAATVFGRRSYEVNALPGMTLRDLLAELSRDAGPGFREKVYDTETGRMNEQLSVFVGPREVRTLLGPDTPLQPGEVITIMPPMAGGCGNARPRGVVKKVDRPDIGRFKI